MFWVLIYIATNFLAQIHLISLGLIDFVSEFVPKSTNCVHRFSRKSASRKKPAHRPAKAAHRLKPAHRPAKAGPAHPQVNAIDLGLISLLHQRPPLASISTPPPSPKQLPPPGRKAATRHHCLLPRARTPSPPPRSAPQLRTRAPARSARSVPSQALSASAAQLRLGPQCQLARRSRCLALCSASARSHQAPSRKPATHTPSIAASRPPQLARLTSLLASSRISAASSPPRSDRK
jgi:hypothetical protein